MAGEWLKMEACTPEKSEVLAITAKMGWDDADLTVGKLFRLWRWFDQQTMDGNAHGVTKALLDRHVGVTGFCDAMESVGWLTISDDGISLPNFDRHNGNTAKSRALTAKRVANHKSNATANAKGNGSSVSRALPREEKRREDIKEANASLRATKKCPASFVLTDEMQAWAATECPGVDVGIETATLRDHEFKTARKDWPGTWRNWMRKAFKDIQNRPAGRQSFAAQDQQRTEQRASELAPGVACRSTSNQPMEDRNVIAIGNR